jgi:hypothetical protein
MKEASTSAEISRAPIQERNSQHRVEEAMRKLSVAFTAAAAKNQMTVQDAPFRPDRRGKLQTDSERLQREIEEYAALSQQVMQRPCLMARWKLLT